jgi:hypothetical protein
MADPFPQSWEIRLLELSVIAYPARKDLCERLQYLRLASSLTLEEIEEQKKIVSEAKKRLAMANNQALDSLPAHGIRWGAYAERSRLAIDELITPLEVLHFSQTQINFEHRGNIHHEVSV